MNEENISETPEILEEAETQPAPSTEVGSKLSTEVLESIVESILFAAEKPISLQRIQEVIGETEAPDVKTLETILHNIEVRYQTSFHGFEIRKAQGGFHFVTKMENAEYVRRYQASKPFKLGRSSLETLAIIAYKQPMTRAEIDQIRGIDSSHLLRTLMERGLVRMTGKADAPGRPVQYGTTPRFLEVVGLAGLNELPPLSELNQIQGDVEDPISKLEKGLDKFLAESKSYMSDGGNVSSDPDVMEPGLVEIEQLLDSADQGIKEVFESELHREIAMENRAAVAAFQAANRRRPRAKKEISFEELTSGVDPEAT